MRRFDKLVPRWAPHYPGHIIHVAGDSARTTARLVAKGGQAEFIIDEPLEAVIHMALLVRQRDALPIGVLDEDGLWPERLGELVPWHPPAHDDRP